MKKRILTMLLVGGMALSLAACGSKAEDVGETAQGNTDSAGNQEQTAENENRGKVSTRDFNPDDYVTVADYSNVMVEINSYTFTDADVMREINSTVDYYLQYTDSYIYTKTDKQTVENGDVVNLDYCGKKDGVAFDGGTAQGAHLEIGSNSFIDGFETGLIGHKIGESFDLPLKFPDNYGNADLVGQDVVFEIKLNSIDSREKPELNDELIVNMEIGYDTLEALKERVSADFQQNCEDKAASENREAVWTKVYSLCEVKDDVPQALLDEVLSGIEQSAQYYADYYKVTVDEFIEQYMGMTKEEYESEMNVSALATAKERLAIAAVAKKEGISLSDDDVKKEAEERCSQLGYSSGEDLLKELGDGYFYDYLLAEKVKDALLTKVSVTENAPKPLIETSETEAAADDASAQDSAEEETADDSQDDAEAQDDEASQQAENDGEQEAADAESEE